LQTSLSAGGSAHSINWGLEAPPIAPKNSINLIYAIKSKYTYEQYIPVVVEAIHGPFLEQDKGYLDFHLPICI